jgi:hypothetical protein
MKKDKRYFDELAGLLRKHGIRARYLNAAGQKDSEQQLLILAAWLRKTNPALFEPFSANNGYTDLVNIIKDIEKIMKRPPEQTAENRRGRGTEQEPERENDNPSPAGTFKERFKELVKIQGIAASPEYTARYLCARMSGSELTRLNQSLDSVGIRTPKEFNRLLSAWKDEALKPGAPERKQELPVSREAGFRR